MIYLQWTLLVFFSLTMGAGIAALEDLIFKNPLLKLVFFWVMFSLWMVFITVGIPR